MSIVTLLLVLVLQNTSDPKFEDFPANVQFPNQPAQLQSTEGAHWAVFGSMDALRGVLQRAMAKGPNFAGHHRVVAWPDAARCLNTAIIDLLNGKVFLDHGTFCHLLLCRLTSRLIIDNPLDSLRFQQESDSDGEIEEEAQMRYFVWEGDSLRLMAVSQTPLATAWKKSDEILPEARPGSTFRSPDGRYGAEIIYTRSQAREAVVEIQDASGRKLCRSDYTSADGEHGYDVGAIGWTADSKYFLYSLWSSGGHQAWAQPVEVYDLQADSVRHLTEYIEYPLTEQQHLRLAGPDSIIVTVEDRGKGSVVDWVQQSFRIRLYELFKRGKWKRE